ncbi:hypothetical protein KR038_006627 [Drosophila bunnanda]|nr:hypothetical protein KR038_006627 [Drosophila bunnanda]
MSEIGSKSNSSRKKSRTMMSVNNDQAPVSNNELLKELVKLTKLVHQIDVNLCSGFGRLLPPYSLAEFPSQGETIPPSEYEERIKELKESLEKAQYELKQNEKLKTGEINALPLELPKKYEGIDNENCAKKQAHNFESQKSKESLLRSAKEIDMQTETIKRNNTFIKNPRKIKEDSKYQKEIEQYKNTLKESLLEAANTQKQMQDAHSQELEKVTADLQAQIKQAQDERKKGLDELEMMREQKQKLQDMFGEMDTYVNSLIEEQSILKAKIDEELRAAKLKEASLDDLISENKALKSSLSRVSSTQQEKVDVLQSQLLAAQKDISSRDEEMEKLRWELKHALEEKDTAIGELSAMTAKLEAEKDKLSKKGIKFEKKTAILNVSISDLQFKIKSLDDQYEYLEIDRNELKVELMNVQNLIRTKNDEIENMKTRLEAQRQEQEAAAHRKSMEFSKVIEELTKECEKLRFDLVS